ncbi:MAG TPA: nicotinate-nucleotide adenylyltransferase [Bryobacteraceae bacterium]|jgi:nicotinate-nucleotide adenylyltransferase|nr:nicotinate-nucleotide adenylyltransferase [Bryobacteraceae bacterium]
MAGKRICLFGGTFDPIHHAHLVMADEAAKRFEMDRVVFIPAGNPPHKDAHGVTPYEGRLEMARLACAGNPKFEVSEMERGDERSYSVNTLERFRSRMSADDRLFFLIGADAFDEIESWHRWQEVIRLAEFIVVSRPGNYYRIPPGAKVMRLDDVQLPVASTTIRAKLAAGEPTPEIPAAVRSYIDAHKLYRAEAKASS